MTDRYAVIGNPVERSELPIIHAEFARETGQDLVYARLLAPLDGFATTVAAFRAAGGRGLNVTNPFKGEAFRLATESSARARAVEAVDTLAFDGTRIFADSTDGVGLCRDITANLGVALRGRRILLVGTGGAARGVVPALLDEVPGSLVVANRTAEKPEELARHFGGIVRAASFGELARHAFDVVVNGTAASLAGEAPPLPAGVFAPGSLAYDMMYGKGETPFLAAARQQGAARLADGLGMLVEQAAESFFIWRGVRAQTGPLLAMLRAAG